MVRVGLTNCARMHTISPQCFQVTVDFNVVPLLTVIFKTAQNADVAVAIEEHNKTKAMTLRLTCVLATKLIGVTRGRRLACTYITINYFTLVTQ